MNILYGDPLDFGNIASWSVHNYEVLSGLSRLGHNVVLINGEQFRNNIGTARNRQPLLQARFKTNLLQSQVLKPIRGEGIILWVFLRDIWRFLQGFMTIVRQKRRFDVIYRRHNLFNCEYLLAKIFNIPSVKEVNGLVADEMKIMGLGNRISLRVMDRIERLNMPKADKIIAVTSILKQVLQEDYKVPAEKIVVISNGANIDLFKPTDVTKAKEELGLSQRNSYVCFVGALHAWQGVQYLIRSAPLVLQECPDARFLVVGDGAMKQELNNLAERVGVSDKIMFTGMVPYLKVPLYINASDVCVFPPEKTYRNDRVGVSSLKLYEYMACGKPIVAGRIRGLDILEQCGAVLLVEPEDSQGLAYGIITLLRNKVLGRELGENGRKYTVENQSWERVARRVAEVCQSLIQSRRPREQ